MMPRTGDHHPNGCGRAYFLLAAVLFFSACVPPPMTVPVGTVRYERPVASDHDLLIVFLPGRGDPPDAFARHGLLEAVRKRGIPADCIGVDLHLGYYLNGSFIERIREDIILPVKASGYRRIWLVGNSLGGYGSLAYLGRHAGDIAGVVLLGPFVGDREDIEAVRQAGGLKAWEPGPLEDKDWKRKLLALLKDYERDRDAYPPLYLGYGTYDKFAYAQRFLSEIIPQERVVVLTGGHEWWTWRRAWEELLDRGMFK